MVTLKLLAAISSSFLLLAKANGADKTVYTVTLGGDGECLEEVNAARQAAGFSVFKQATTGAGASQLPAGSSCETTEPETYKKWVWKPVCESLIPSEANELESLSDPEGPKFQSGTYAYHVADTNAFNCTAMVENWKAAYSSFSGLPPAKKENLDLYSKQETISFVAMYNSSENATADCRRVTCEKKTTTGAGDNVAGTTKTETASALVCMTTPDVLHTDESKAPFTEDQWAQIVTAFEGSASALSPGVVVIALAIFGLTML